MFNNLEYCAILLYICSSKEGKMKIEKELLKKWKQLKSNDDNRKLVDSLTGSYPEMFNRAFRTGKCSDECFSHMAEFYKRKEEMIKQYL